MYSYDDLLLFANVVDLKTYTKAAKVLKLTQPTISRRMKSLENSLGFKLFFQDGSSMKLTKDGHSLFVSVKSKLPHFSDLDSDIEYIQTAKTSPNGKVFVSFSSLVTKTFITPYIDIFNNRYPEIELNIMIRNSVSDFEMVDEDLDFVITVFMPDSPHQRNYLLKKLMNVEVGLYCTDEYIKKYGAPQTIKEISNHKVVGHLKNNKTKEPIIGLKNVNTNEIISIPGGVRSSIWINDGNHMKVLLDSNEFISLRYNNFPQTPSYIRVLSDYVVYDPNNNFSTIYLVKHPYKEQLSSKLFSEFIVKIFQLIDEGCENIRDELLKSYSIKV